MLAGVKQTEHVQLKPLKASQTLNDSDLPKRTAVASGKQCILAAQQETQSQFTAEKMLSGYFSRAQINNKTYSEAL